LINFTKNIKDCSLKKGIITPLLDIYFMQEALKMANHALELEEVPVGAVIVNNGRIIARACNLKESLMLPTAHAEIIAINQAAFVFNDWRLLNCDIYVTVEPCPMCASAIIQARISRLIFGVKEPRWGSLDIFKKKYNHIVEVTGGVLEQACKELIVNFFKKRRGG